MGSKPEYNRRGENTVIDLNKLEEVLKVSINEKSEEK